MLHLDEVIRQSAIAAEYHATGVARALRAYLASGCGTPELAALRAELVALAAGFEPSAHDGSTYEGRCKAAVAALEAFSIWEQGATIPGAEMARHAGLGVSAPAVTWRAFGAGVYADGSVGTLPFGGEELLLLGIDICGSRGESAVIWAMAEKRRRHEVEGQRAAENKLAGAVSQLAAQIGAESAESLVERMPERLRAYAREVLRSRQG